MPPRYAYWTILVDEQPTAFRAAQQEDLMPTFKRLMQKHPSAKLVWFQNGKIWPSRLDAQEAMRARGEAGRRGDARQGGGFRDRQRSARPHDLKTSRPPEKLEWKPKGEFTPAPKRSERPEWKPKGSVDRERKPEWKPKGSFDRDRKSEWKPRGTQSGNFAPGTPRGRKPAASGTLDWQPRREPGTTKRKWVPKAEYQKSRGIERPRDSKWRPGGDHRDPKQKYKDAKKAKWTRFKQTIRKRWETKQGKPPDKKRRDEE